jgi:hypothetical protein
MHIPASDCHTRTPGQDEVASAPCITFAQFRRMAKRHEWSAEFLVEQSYGELDLPTVRRVLNGAPVNGRQDKLESTVVPYWPLIQLYQNHG